MSREDNHFVKKIILGTVQFGLDYGISNQQGQTQFAEVNTILQQAADEGIEILDTAYVYGNSEKILGECPVSKTFKIISKFPCPQNDRTLKSYLLETLSSLNRKSLFGFLAHDADSIFKQNLWDQLLEIRKQKLASKIGFSLYKPRQLHDLLGAGFIPDIVQLPYNAFDRRFEPMFVTLKSLNVEIHVRSVFLQGLFFVKPNLLPSHFYPIKHLLLKLREIFPNDKILASELMNFCLKHPLIDKIIIGVNQASQLASNISSLKLPFGDFNWSEYEISDESILLPYNWPNIRR